MDVEEPFTFTHEDIEEIREKDEVEFIPPWMKYQYLGTGWNQRKKEHTKVMLEDISDLSSRAEMFFRHSSNVYVASQVCTNEISEYLDLKFFYKEFGLKPWELEFCDAEWVEKMIAINNAENRIKKENYTNERDERKKESKEETLPSEEGDYSGIPLYPE